MKEDVKLILSIIIIVCSLLMILSLILPWGHYSIPNSDAKLDLYNWGAHTIEYNFFNQSGFLRDSWVPYLGITEFSSMLHGVDNYAVRAGWSIAISIFPLMIVGLCIVPIGHNKYMKEFDTYICLSASLFLISLVLFFIFIHFGMYSLMIHIGLSNAVFSIGIGFILALIATIILLISHLIQYFVDI